MLIVFGLTMWSGGFGDSARLVLVVIGAVGLLTSALRSPDSLTSAFRSVPVAALFALSLVGAASLAWTSAGVPEAMLVAMTPAAYAGLVIFAAGDPLLRKRRTLVGIWLAAFAVLSAITGLAGILFEIEPWGIWLDGRLRPAGVLEYPPALALLQLGAMPVLARGLLAVTGRLRILASGSLVIGAAIILLAQSRMILFLAGALIVVWGIWPERSLGVSRRESMYPTLLWLAGGSVLALTFWTFSSWPALIISLILIGGMSWIASRGLQRQRSREAAAKHGKLPVSAFAATLILGLLAFGLSVLLLASNDPSAQGVQGDQGFDHGRIELWRVSVNAALEEPLLGHGQGAFLETTIEDQESPVWFAHSLVLESAVETGLAGGLLAAVILFGSMACSWKRRLDLTAWLYIPMVVGFSALALVDWTWHLTGVGATWALCLGCLLIVAPRDPGTICVDA